MSNAFESRINAQFDRNGSLWALYCPKVMCLMAGAGHQANGVINHARYATDIAGPQLGIMPGSTNALLEDMEGNIWVATQTGLDRFRENSLIPVRLPQASGNFSMGGDSEGNVWLSDLGTSHLAPAPGAEPERSRATTTHHRQPRRRAADGGLRASSAANGQVSRIRCRRQRQSRHRPRRHDGRRQGALDRDRKPA
jgi:hypothetical protein